MISKLIFCLAIVFTFNFAFSQKKFAGHGSQIKLEYFGPGGLFSIQFESRFLKQTDGLGYTIGIGAAPYELEETCNQGGFLTNPIGLNYLLGKKDHLLEIGGGMVLKIFGGGTKVYCPAIDDNFYENGNAFYLYSLVGYRYQPVSRRLSWRIFASPLFQKDFSPKFWGGISMGIKFGRPK